MPVEDTVFEAVWVVCTAGRISSVVEYFKQPIETGSQDPDEVARQLTYIEETTQEREICLAQRPEEESQQPIADADAGGQAAAKASGKGSKKKGAQRKGKRQEVEDEMNADAEKEGARGPKTAARDPGAVKQGKGKRKRRQQDTEDDDVVAGRDVAGSSEAADIQDRGQEQHDQGARNKPAKGKNKKKQRSATVSAQEQGQQAQNPVAKRQGNGKTRKRKGSADDGAGLGRGAAGSSEAADAQEDRLGQQQHDQDAKGDLPEENKKKQRSASSIAGNLGHLVDVDLEAERRAYNTECVRRQMRRQKAVMSWGRFWRLTAVKHVREIETQERKKAKARANLG